MKLSSTKLRIITVLIFLMKQGILANQIDGTNNLEMSFLNDELEVEPKIELIEKKFESEENQGTNRFQYRRGIPIDEDIFQTDKDPTFIQEAILKLSKEVLSKLEGELKKKIQSELEDDSLDSLSWPKFSESEIKNIKKALLEAISPYIEPLIEKTAQILPITMFNLQEGLNFSEKDEL